MDTRELEMQRNLRQRNVQIGCVDDGTTKIGHDECDVFIDRGQNTDIENDELGVELTHALDLDAMRLSHRSRIEHRFRDL
ncbi:MAG: hypothetical protein AAGJ56_07215, partial [Myxococcota bacterium]